MASASTDNEFDVEKIVKEMRDKNFDKREEAVRHISKMCGAPGGLFSSYSYKSIDITFGYAEHPDFFVWLKRGFQIISAYRELDPTFLNYSDRFSIELVNRWSIDYVDKFCRHILPDIPYIETLILYGVQVSLTPNEKTILQNAKWGEHNQNLTRVSASYCFLPEDTFLMLKACSHPPNLKYLYIGWLPNPGSEEFDPLLALRNPPKDLHPLVEFPFSADDLRNKTKLDRIVQQCENGTSPIRLSSELEHFIREAPFIRNNKGSIKFDYDIFMGQCLVIYLKTAFWTPLMREKREDLTKIDKYIQKLCFNLHKQVHDPEWGIAENKSERFRLIHEFIRMGLLRQQKQQRDACIICLDHVDRRVKLIEEGCDTANHNNMNEGCQVMICDKCFEEYKIESRKDRLGNIICPQCRKPIVATRKETDDTLIEFHVHPKLQQRCNDCGGIKQR